ncbi:hypothetical protein SAMN05444673_6613 [Bacillus sp. OV166]|uniref:hypothetical protein n=1 Tax=Bacillus sp. OV166 TaxID=1882763 RepID=UPI000A2ABCB7|nr:hypothetical protein [Bacillus sp. OV166]SMQ86618.1 hypothetical protein SAMN05444673_6613 [Bacillus sp. OV166]
MDTQIVTISWKDDFEEEHLLIEGKGDVVFHVITKRYIEDGDSYVRILSRKAILEFAKQIQK